MQHLKITPIASKCSISFKDNFRAIYYTDMVYCKDRFNEVKSETANP